MNWKRPLLIGVAVAVMLGFALWRWMDAGSALPSDEALVRQFMMTVSSELPAGEMIEFPRGEAGVVRLRQPGYAIVCARIRNGRYNGSTFQIAFRPGSSGLTQERLNTPGHPTNEYFPPCAPGN